MNTERVPPQSEEAEKGVLGAAMLDGTAAMDILRSAQLTRESFYLPAHRAIWEAIAELYDAGKPIDLLTVSDRMTANGTLEKIGGAAALNRICDETPVTANVGYYAAIVREKQILRGVIARAREIEHEAYTNDNAEAVLAMAPGKFDHILDAVVTEPSNTEIMDQLIVKWEDAAAGKKQAVGILTPWQELNRSMLGLEVGVTIVAGRPSAGKTTLEDQVAQAAAQEGLPVYRVTMDSSHESLLARAICRNSGVSLAKLKFGFAGKSKSNMLEVRAARDTLKSLPLFIDTKSSDIAQIRTGARRMKSKHGVGLITVDYIQLIRAAEMGRSEWDSVARVTYVSRELKALAMELNLPVVVLSQLSRLVETENREPKLSDLRDSGAIEQDANKVVFVYVDTKKRKEMEEKSFGATKHKRPVWFNLMKHKDGECGAVAMWMYPPYFNFDEAQCTDQLDFVDDSLPGSHLNDERDMGQRPSFAPAAEGVTDRNIKRFQQANMEFRNDPPDEN